MRTSASRGFCQGRARRGPPPTWDVWLRGGPRHTPGWPLKRRFCVCTGVSAVTAVWVTDAHACVCSCGQRGRACPGEPACTGAVGACGVGACAGVRRTRASVEGRSCGRLGRRGWALSVTEVPCPAPGWWLHARDLIWPGHPVEWAAPPHLAGEDMQAELSHLLKVTQVGERGFSTSRQHCSQHRHPLQSPGVHLSTQVGAQWGAGKKGGLAMQGVTGLRP